jgi:hypothetical protein
VSALSGVRPPVGGRATVEQLHGVANWLGFFLGPAKARGSTHLESKSMADGGEDLLRHRPFEQQRTWRAQAQRQWLSNPSVLRQASTPTLPSGQIDRWPTTVQ